MRTIDKLRLEVERINREEELEKAKLKTEELFYETKLKPVMLAATEYFYEFTSNLRIISPDIQAGYHLDITKTQAVFLKQSDYICRADSRVKPRQIDIICSCSLEKPYEFYVPSKIGAAKQAELLDNYSFTYRRKNKIDSLYEICGATFFLEGPMTVRIRIIARPEEECIELVIRNIDNDPAAKHYKFPEDKFDEKFLDRLGKLIIREVSQIVDFNVPEEAREKLRGQLALERLREEQHLAMVDADIEAEAAENSKSKNISFIVKDRLKLLGRASKAIRELTKK